MNPTGDASELRNHGSAKKRIALKRLQINDYNRMIECWNESQLHIRVKGRDSKESIQRQMQLPDVRFLGAFDAENRNLVGLAIGSYDGRRGWINRLSVLPEYRGQGVATAIIAKLEEFLKKKGAKLVAALIDKENVASRELFEKNGYSNNENILYYSKRDNPDV